MRREHRKIQFFLVLVLITSIPVVSALFHCYSLSEADFLSIQLKFEAPDQINLSPVCKDKFKAFGSGGFNDLFFPDNNIFGQFPVISSSQISPLDLTTFILRC